MYTQNGKTFNLINFELWATTVGVNTGNAKKVVTDQAITLSATGNDEVYTLYSASGFPVNARIPVTAGQTLYITWKYSESTANTSSAFYIFGNGDASKLSYNNGYVENLTYTVPNDVTFVTFRVGMGNNQNGRSVTYSDLQIITSDIYSAGFTEYAPYSLSNTTITPELIELCDSGAKNLFTTSLPTQEFNVTAVSESDTTGTISCKSNGAWARMAHKITLPAGSYIVSFKVTAHGSNSVIFGDSQFDGQGTHLFWCENLQNTSYTVSITTTSTATWYLAFAVNQSNTSSTTDVLTVTDFMVCTKAAFAVSPKFVPYRLPYDDVQSKTTLLMNNMGGLTFN